jgi:hypothetical protein
MGNLTTFSDAYKTMGPEDKEALRQLQAEEQKRLGVPVSLADVVRAVTPGFETPAYLLFKQ